MYFIKITLGLNTFVRIIGVIAIWNLRTYFRFEFKAIGFRQFYSFNP